MSATDQNRTVLVQPTSAIRGEDAILLGARLLLVCLFLVFGWDKLVHFGATVNMMSQRALPLPRAAAAVAVGAEVLVCLLILVGAWTRPLALVLAAYTLATGLIGHRFWELEGPARYANAINFYKNLSIVGGLLLLYVTGPGKYSVDAKLGGVDGFHQHEPACETDDG
jgi:putative oxidoreductase